MYRVYHNDELVLETHDMNYAYQRYAELPWFERRVDFEPESILSQA